MEGSPGIFTYCRRAVGMLALQGQGLLVALLLQRASSCSLPNVQHQSPKGSESLAAARLAPAGGWRGCRLSRRCCAFALRHTTPPPPGGGAPKLHPHACTRARLHRWQDFVGNWGPSGVVDLKDQLAVLTTMTASRTLLGEPPRPAQYPSELSSTPQRIAQHTPRNLPGTTPAVARKAPCCRRPALLSVQHRSKSHVSLRRV